MTNKKHCYCGRRRHYQPGNPLERRQSVSPARTESDDDAMLMDLDSPVDEPLPNYSRRRAPSPTCEEVDEDVVGDEDEDEDEPMSDAEESDTMNDFDEEEDRVDVVSREEMIRELEDMLGPDEEAEL
ncbi:hypothetical protein C8R46DRAFT_1029353 [Mycena filopes]|nr:hypothetical protein C8R46DRAFT_1029353 [Mycena filopes]